MSFLIAIAGFCALGIAILLAAIFLGRLLYLAIKELRRRRFATEQLIIAERENRDLLTKLVVREYGKRKCSCAHHPSE